MSALFVAPSRSPSPVGGGDGGVGGDAAAAIVPIIPDEWRLALAAQALGRRFLLRRRVNAKRTVAALAKRVAEARVTRDVKALMEAIQARAIGLPAVACCCCCLLRRCQLPHA